MSHLETDTHGRGVLGGDRAHATARTYQTVTWRGDDGTRAVMLSAGRKGCADTAWRTGGLSMRLLVPLIMVSTALGWWTSVPLCWAGLAQGVTAYKLGDFATAVHEFLPLAQHGHAEAQFYLGAMASKGWGVPQDDTAAAHWYQRAA